MQYTCKKFYIHHYTTADTTEVTARNHGSHISQNVQPRGAIFGANKIKSKGLVIKCSSSNNALTMSH